MRYKPSSVLCWAKVSCGLQPVLTAVQKKDINMCASMYEAWGHGAAYVNLPRGRSVISCLWLIGGLRKPGMELASWPHFAALLFTPPFPTIIITCTCIYRWENTQGVFQALMSQRSYNSVAQDKRIANHRVTDDDLFECVHFSAIRYTMSNLIP